MRIPIEVLRVEQLAWSSHNRKRTLPFQISSDPYAFQASNQARDSDRKLCEFCYSWIRACRGHNSSKGILVPVDVRMQTMDFSERSAAIGLHADKLRRESVLQCCMTFIN